MLSDYVNRFVGWLENPLHEEMTALDWLLFVGLILWAVYVWAWIVRRIAE